MKKRGRDLSADTRPGNGTHKRVCNANDWARHSDTSNECGGSHTGEQGRSEDCAIERNHRNMRTWDAIDSSKEIAASKSTHTSLWTSQEQRSQNRRTQQESSEPSRKVIDLGVGLQVRDNSSPARNEKQKTLGEMNSEEVARWVRQVLMQDGSPSARTCVDEVAQAFRANLVSGIDVLALTPDDLREELGISTLAARKALTKAIRAHTQGTA